MPVEELQGPFKDKSKMAHKLVRPVVHLFTKRDCHLCDVVKAVMASSTIPHEVVMVNITLPGRRAWFDKYKYDIPVLYINGQYMAKHRITKESFEETARRIMAGEKIPQAILAEDPNPDLPIGPLPDTSDPL
ncbi:hypothetical protein PTSG_09527 [Salpingoeca rosetta]|uniref:Glutaredoxin-like protein n=1 Tax=Salpingoeca rosetta (strain ATCC 50818 / BSB-021) TaxID=946362 RepID=F2UL94_SALR5|nr:uncharacterized protein PTSG_09527 [Salpingoeca rosetta]EGD77893.1 hypothetical protein PTSG_09527 [Salpingoeca rosetta]|eukprot:XP_004989957.1 hypothetical protein PTSG_09527 [Salpingoeca rosetta]